MALAIVLLWRTPAPAPAVAVPAPPAVDDAPRLENPLAERDPVAGEPGPRPAAPFPAELFDEQRYDGLGRLEIHVATASGARWPQEWSLELAPSHVLIGGHRAVARTLAFVDGRETVVLDDVPLGSYEVRARAAGLECRPEHVALAKPDELDVIVRLVVYPMGAVSGRVVDTDGRAIEGLDVVLASATTSALRTAPTDRAGIYVFEQVPDGDYRLFVGPQGAPLAEISDLSFSAPSLHAPDIVVPPLGELRVRVVDREGHPVAGALVEGSGLRSGPFTLTTDSEGRARAPLCSQGQIFFYAAEEQVGAGNAVARFDPAASAEIEIAIGK